MTKANQDIPRNDDERYVAGDPAVISVSVVDDNGDSKNIAGLDVKFGLAEYSGGDPLVTKDETDPDVSKTNPTDGKIEVVIDSEDTAELGSADGTTYYYEITVDGVTVTTGDWEIYADTI